MVEDPELRRLLWFVLGGARGGENRARIIDWLSKRPSNLNQLAAALGVDYRTVMHHVGVLKRNSLIMAEGSGYGVTYFVSPRLEANMEIFKEICRKLRYNLAGG
jgi:DNA-binding transcriptional ArsR family regulator